MDSFETFMEIFRRCAGDKEGLLHILKDGRRYFQNVSVDDSEKVLSILFNPEDGLLRFLNDHIFRSSTNRFTSIIKEAFLLLQFVMEQFTEQFTPYVLDTKNLCERTLMARCSIFFRRAACSTFQKLITLFKEFQIGLDKTLQAYVEKLHTLDLKDRSLIFPVLGKIARYYPEIPNITKHSYTIFKYLRQDFKARFTHESIKDTQPVEIENYVETFADILDTFSPPEQIREKCYKELYGWIKPLCSVSLYRIKKTLMRSAIDLLCGHMNLFAKFVYNDYKYWYFEFTKLLQEKGPNATCGYNALKMFYKTIGRFLKGRSSTEDKEVFMYFKNILIEQLQSDQLDLYELQLVVYGLSKLAAACKTYFSDSDLKHIYTLISLHAVSFCYREDTKHLENVCYYQEALSEIISYSSDASMDQLNVLINLSTLLLKRFPDLSITSRNFAVCSIIRTIVNVGLLNKTYLEEYLHNIVYNGILWSCSHTLYIDAELQRGLNNLSGRPICYKNYLPLWRELFNPGRYKFHEMQYLQEIFDKFISVCIVLMHKLNLNTKIKENNVLSDMALSQTAVNETDFRIFVNLVDLYVDVVNGLEYSLLLKHVHTFLSEVISMSYKFPLISGFYKLAHATLKSSEMTSAISTEEDEVELFEMVHKYLSNTLDMIYTFSNELLISSLYLILDMPLVYVKSMLNRTIPVFKISFEIGLTDFDLAWAAFATLERWSCHLQRQWIKEFLQEVIPSLEPFLQSRESTVELLQDIIKTERKMVKHITLVDSTKSLENFQTKVLVFLGTVDSDVLLDFVHKRALNTKASWDKKNLLKYTLPFPDLQVDIYFDKMLPRLITLAQSSCDRRTKVVACELLHAVIALILGKTVQTIGTSADRFAALYSTLCPAMLNLGCNVDEVVRQLFQPLTLQLMHWLSSELMFKAPATVFLIDSIFDGLCSEANSSLREFSGLCLAEFMEWSMKQLDETNYYVNVHMIMRKITNFSLHPSARKRVAAAVAFNHLYKILREDDDIIRIYWLEILYCFIKSLDGCHDPSISNAIDHVERVIKVKSDVLSTSDQRCRKTEKFEGSTINNVVHWLFTQCGCLDQTCRLKCMQLYINISPHIVNCEPDATPIEQYINLKGIEKFNHIILGDLNPKMEDASTKNVLPLLKSFDCYIWLIKEKLINLEYLFSNINPNMDVIFDNIKNFVHLFTRVKIETDTGVIMVSKDLEELQTLRCKTIIRMLELIQILLELNENVIPDFILTSELFELICRCIMSPQSVGFDAKNITISETLPSCLENLLHLMIKKFNAHSLNCLQEQLLCHVQKYVSDIFHVREIITQDDCTCLKQYIKGLIILERCKILKELCKEHFEHLQDKVDLIFESLKDRQTDQLLCTSLSPTAMEYLTILMELLLTNYETSMVKKLATLIMDNTILSALGSRKIRHGEYFLNTFKNTIFRYLFKNVEESVMLLIVTLQENSSLLLTTVECFLLFVQRNKKELEDSLETVTNVVISQSCTFARAASNTAIGKQRLIGIFGICVRLQRQSTETISMSEDMYKWILKQLTDNSDIEYKTHILENFWTCLDESMFDNKPELVAILRTLKADSTDVLKVRNCLETLLKLLPNSKSLMLFETIIIYAENFSVHLGNENFNDHLKKYFHRLSPERALVSLERVYKIFMEDAQLDTLRKFLLPSFEFCNTSIIQEFFERNIAEMCSILDQNIVGAADTTNLCILKIGCFDLASVMFAKVPTQNIIDPNSVITRSVIKDVSDGKELLQKIHLCAIRVRGLKAVPGESKKIMRLLHCSAYNCSIAIVCLSDDEKSYKTVFGENKAKGQLIWRNIIDCSKEYNLKQSFKEYPNNKRKLVNIRKCVTDGKTAGHENYSYNYKYNLNTVTLKEDINAYDFNEATILPKSDGDKEESMSLLFESDDFNNHECMPSIVGVLIHMKEKQIASSPSSENAEMPIWLKCFHNAMLLADHDNIRLFMLRIILNVESVFKPYAKHFLLPITNALNTYLKNEPFNYIITDVLLMLIEWHTVAVPSEGKDKIMAQKLFETIVDKVIIEKPIDLSSSIYHYNINILKMLIEVWHTCLDIPKNLSEKMDSAPDATVRFIVICLANKIYKSIIYRDDILEFLQTSLDMWQDKEETVVLAFEALGMILNFSKESDDFAEKRCSIQKKIQSTLQLMRTRFLKKQITCFHAVIKNYTNIDMECFEFTSRNCGTLDSSIKLTCLEVFLLLIPKLTEEQIMQNLRCMMFDRILRDKIKACEKNALKVIDALVKILSPSKFIKLVNLVPPYTKSESFEKRELAYNIFINAYERYSRDISENEDVKNIMLTSMQVLVAGVLDPAINLQEKLLEFWTTKAVLSDKSQERLIEILSMYSQDSGDVFLPFIALSMLNLVSKSPSYTTKMFEPLYECKYMDYDIAVSWRTTNLGSVAPLFAPSLASQISQVFTQTGSIAHGVANVSQLMSMVKSNPGLRLRATQDRHFEPTRDNNVAVTSAVDVPRYDGEFKIPKIPQPAFSKRSRRFLDNSFAVTNMIRDKEIEKNVQRREMIKEEGIRQRSTVKLYRKYRIGDFPDIEITHSSLIVPLQELVKKDQLICKNMMIAIISSLVDTVLDRTDDFAKKVSDVLRKILDNCPTSNSVVAAILEILITCDPVRCYPDTVAQISRKNNLNCLGILLLEENLICGKEDVQQPAKKIKLDPNASDCVSDKWVQLAGLYKSLNEVDIVLSIMRNHTRNKNLQDASFAQASGNWVKAKLAYKAAYESEAVAIKEHCLQGSLECLRNLSNWNEIDNHIKDQLDGDVNNIWDNPWKDWLLPWIFDSCLYRSLDGDVDNEFLIHSISAIDSWIKDDRYTPLLKRECGEKIAVLFLLDAGKDMDARVFLESALNEVREQWITLNPLTKQSRIHILEKLSEISDINMYTKALKKTESFSEIRNLLNFWSDFVPTVHDNLLQWDKLTRYRTRFINLLKVNVETEGEELMDTQELEQDKVLKKMSYVYFQQQLKTIMMSLHQKNKFIARRHIRKVERERANCPLDFMQQLKLTGGKMRNLNAEIETDIGKKMSHYVSSWKYLHKLLQEDDLDPAFSVGIRQDISATAITLLQLSKDNAEFEQLLKKERIIFEQIRADSDDTEEIRRALHLYCFNNLKECCNTDATNITDCYCILSKYCYDNLSNDETNLTLSREFVKSTLKGMSCGSSKAAHYFPCLLKPQYLEDDEAKAVFVEESQVIETWLFLSWQAQLFSHLTTSIAPLVIPIIERIVKTYPNAVIYTFRLTVETNPALMNDPRTYEIRRILYENPDVEKFLKAIQYVVQPELFLQFHLVEFLKNLSQGPATAIEMLLQRVYPSEGVNGDNPRPGNIFKEITKYRNTIRDWGRKKVNEITRSCIDLMETLKQNLSRRQNRVRLKDYSPWLNEYTGDNLEIPGQYSGNRKPMPQYHAKIMRVEATVKVMQSLRKPVRITLVGNDAKDYNFLVKFGEDLRLDQRLQQLFVIMNKTLCSDVSCMQRQLSIDTYQVIPLSKTLGLIQWVEDTRPLQDLIYFTLSKTQEDQHSSICKEYTTWIQRAAPSKKDHEQYKEAMIKYSASVVATKMKELIAKTQWDALRATFLTLSPSLESFMSLRHNFITSYAVMCIAHWILGIGDRHLGNTLVVVGSGRSLGIDFGLAFGAGIDLRVPELMPFRLTSQILGVLKPFTEKDLLGTTMIHVLRALRNDKGPILACLDVFVHEPLDWTEHVKKALKEADEETIDVKWLPKKKIVAVEKKLNGIKPSLITLEHNVYMKSFDIHLLGE